MAAGGWIICRCASALTRANGDFADLLLRAERPPAADLAALQIIAPRHTRHTAKIKRTRRAFFMKYCSAAGDKSRGFRATFKGPPDSAHRCHRHLYRGEHDARSGRGRVEAPWRKTQVLATPTRIPQLTHHGFEIVDKRSAKCAWTLLGRMFQELNPGLAARNPTRKSGRRIGPLRGPHQHNHQWWCAARATSQAARY